jgi:hypothetical protein
MTLLQKKTLFILLIILFSCKKQQPGHIIPVVPKPVYKIELLSGANQTDTVGHKLKDEVVVKVYKDGVLYGNSIVYFERSGCSSDYPSYSFTADPEGINGLNWALNEVVGKQTLKIVLCDLQKNHLDSISITANAIQASGKGLLTPACAVAPVYTDSTEFYKLNSGRIIANSPGSPRYSDDNGLSWRAIEALNNVMLRKMVVTSDDRIFALTAYGVLYSTDKGISWRRIVYDNPDYNSLYDVTYTRSGKLFYSDNKNTGDINISSDNGLTWKSSQLPAIYGGINVFGLTEQTNGDLFLLGSTGELYKSTDSGANWKLLNVYNPNGKTQFESIFIDENGYIYLGQNNYDSGVYLSTDNGQTVNRINFTPDVFAQPFVYPNKITKQHDGYYYINTVRSGSYRTKNFVNIENLNTRYKLKITDAIVANNDNLIVTDGVFGHMWYLPN